MGESVLLGHGPCASCSSSDACAEYDDGHKFCFSCNTNFPSGSPAVQPRVKKAKALLPRGDIKELRARGIREETCKKFGYFVSEYNGKPVQVAPYFDAEGNEVAQKLRFHDKDFTVLGDLKAAGLFGQQLWRSGGKRIVVTEGEIDCLSVAQAFGLNWQVVSVPNGAAGAKKAIQKHLEFLESYDEIVLWFDNDDPGRKAAAECAELFTPGKCKVVSVSGYKDANEMLQAGKIKEICVAVYEAKTKRPDGIVCGADLFDIIAEPIKEGITFPWMGLNEKTFGLRPGEIMTICAGSGIGKSALCGELGYHWLVKEGLKVGHVALEENCGRTALRYMGIHLSRPIHVPSRPAFMERLRKLLGLTVPNSSQLSESDEDKEQRREAFEATMGTGRLFFFDHFGSLGVDHLFSKLRYLVKGLGCDVLILDHLSIVVSGLDMDTDERRAIDRAMTLLRSFTEETGARLVLVSHLRRANGKSHEEGAETSLSDLRGSQAIAQLSDFVLGAERNQQADNDEERNVTTLRVLKNRFTGDTGVCGKVRYDKETGRLSEIVDLPFEAVSDGHEDF